MDESGVVACQAPATCTINLTSFTYINNYIPCLKISDTVTFDNSYSLLRSKKLHYSVYLTHSVTKLAESLTLEDTTFEDEKTLRNGNSSNAIDVCRNMSTAM